MAAPLKDIWRKEPEAHDFPAAADYLELIMPPADAARVVAALKRAKTIRKKAKDLARASALPILSADNYHVAKDLKKVRNGQLLSPVLIVRGKLAKGVDLTIADGYHRISASYHLDEDAEIPCRIVDF